MAAVRQTSSTDTLRLPAYHSLEAAVSSPGSGHLVRLSAGEPYAPTFLANGATASLGPHAVDAQYRVEVAFGWIDLEIAPVDFPTLEEAIAGGALETLSKVSDEGDGVTTAFTLEDGAGLLAKEVSVYQDGVRQKPTTDYTVADAGADLTITFAIAPADGVSLHFSATRFAA